ncbi:MAG: ShlB/FhaC/HecB family hemolysin secretion/activation protein, partial [Vampirovibrionia bacterium]
MLKKKILVLIAIFICFLNQQSYSQTLPPISADAARQLNTDVQTDNARNINNANASILPYKSSEIESDMDTNTDSDNSSFVDAKESVQEDTSVNKEIQNPAISKTIERIETNPSEILSDQDLETVTNPFIGKPITIETLNEITNKITDLFRTKGFVTAKAYIPEQKIDHGVVKIQLVEGKVGQIYVEGNRWTKKNYILSKLREKPDKLLNLAHLEQDITKFNRDNSVKLRANVKPGKEFGTTDLYIQAVDRNVWHLTPTFDNTGRDTIGVLRGGVSFKSDSLFGYRDQFVMGYSRAKSTNLAYSSYSIPIGNKGTRVGASFDFSSIKISNGPYKDFNIEGNAYNYSGFISQDFINTPRFNFSGDLGVNFRQSTTFFQEIPLFTTQVRSLVAGLNFQLRDKYGYWSSRHSFNNGLDLLGGNVRYFKYNAYLTRVHSFGHGVLGIFRGAVQLTDDRLPPVEQFQIGGSSTVRGYSEGLLLGDNGYFLSAELRFPLMFLP